MKRITHSFVAAFSLTLFFASFIIRAAENDATKTTLASYEKVRAALASDDLNAAKQAAASLAKQAVALKNDALAKNANALAGSSNLEAARDQFKAISRAVIPIVKGKTGYYVITCPMANASWVQTDKNVQNPYLGKKMLTCGEVQEASSNADPPASSSSNHAGHDSMSGGCGHGNCSM